MKPDWTSVLDFGTQRRRMVDPSLCERTIRFSQTGIREAIVAGSFELPLPTLKHIQHSSKRSFVATVR